MELSDKTRMFASVEAESIDIAAELKEICKALEEKGYRPIDQIVGYLLTGDPSYITSHMNARVRIQQIGRNDLLEEIVGSYLGNLR
ncbi:MAG: IreB family regulatory phosphoprotein [Limnochordia bacterium]|nr:IreB family regulatory phosphoprotein [Bacillota bacterium]HOB09358.1 IreB family regulatory phosphoprotein [Limnochordia bacterium]HPT93361.1 IreB family regulatory phosphoprotein [Limnochordia bacterium]HPZ30454.1 IreB family regulatory phosphoprotein [Limnochordia bacterium]HQD70760.1 IreB family regulatory phosphoprotein [Limnochordia bacterium]